MFLREQFTKKIICSVEDSSEFLREILYFKGAFKLEKLLPKFAETGWWESCSRENFDIQEQPNGFSIDIFGDNGMVSLELVHESTIKKWEEVKY